MARGSTLNLAGAAFSGAATVALTVLVTRNFSKPVAGAFFTAISLFLIAETAATDTAATGTMAARRMAETRSSRPIDLRPAMKFTRPT